MKYLQTRGPVMALSPEQPARPFAAHPAGMARCALLGIGMLAVAACSRPAAEAEPVPRVLVVRAGAAAASAGATGDDQVFPATLLARHEVALGFRTGGRVLTRRVEVGSRVTADQVLGTLDAADYQLNAALANDQRRAADVELAQAERDAARFGRLGTEGALPTAEQERQRARADATAQKVQEAGHQAALAERRVGYTELRAPFTGVITQLQFEPGLVVPEGQAVLTLADPTQQEVVADLPEQLAARLGHLRLSASLPGAVGGNGVDAPGAVPQAAPAKGAAAKTAVANGAAAISAARVPLRVREVAPQANPLGRTVRVRLTPVAPLTAAGRQLQGLGRSVDLHVQEDGQRAQQGAIDLPAAALVQTSAGPFVYVLEAPVAAPGAASGGGGVLRVQPVQVDAYSPQQVTVRGVPAGARVVAAGVQKLHDGLRVLPLERTGSGTDWAPQP